jgi:protein-tyrosine phosphatase
MVCTGNICRSPMAEGFTRRFLEERGTEGVRVESAGVSGWEGSGPTEEAVQALEEKGIDISHHLARRLNRRMIESADLIVAMSREHRDATLRIVPTAAGRTFTLKELVHLLEGNRWPTTDDPLSPPERMMARIERANARRGVLPGGIREADVGDPLGKGLGAFRHAAWELESLSERLVAGLLGPADGEDAAKKRDGDTLPEVSMREAGPV